MDLIAETKGMGAIGVILIILVSGFFFTMFYIVLDNYYTNLLPQLTTNASTLLYFNSTLVPFKNFMPWIFLFSIVLFGIIQMQNPMSMASFGIVWIVILFSYFTMSMMFVVLDPWLITNLPAMLTMETNFNDYYNNGFIPLWRGSPIALTVLLFFFGLYFATSYFQQSGNVYRGGMGGY